jgi:hypothetical protein
MYNPKLVKQLLGSVAELFDGTIEIERSDGKMFGNLKVGDKLTFTLKDFAKDVPSRQFIVTTGKK